MSAQVAADLRAAADVLERDGWVRGTYHKPCGHCVQGAIAVAVGRGKSPRPDRWKYEGRMHRRFDAANAALVQYLHTQPGLKYWTSHDWNDDIARSADEVTAALRAAADRAEADQ